MIKRLGGAAFFLSCLVLSCGLPTYEVLEAPKIYSPGGYTVGFQTPDDSTIDGYVIYYKIYKDNDLSINADRNKFNESYYDDDGEIPSGTSLPESLGFYKLGYVGETENSSFPHIPLTGSGHEVVFNFTAALSQSGGSDPVLKVDGSDFSSAVGIPARGVVYSAVSEYGSGDNSMKRFVKNYEFANSDNEYDADLASMRSSNGASFAGITKIEIALVAISYGISDANFEQLMSPPVHLGTVPQNDFADNALDQAIKD